MYQRAHAHADVDCLPVEFDAGTFFRKEVKSPQEVQDHTLFIFSFFFN